MGLGVAGTHSRDLGTAQGHRRSTAALGSAQPGKGEIARRSRSWGEGDACSEQRARGCHQNQFVGYAGLLSLQNLSFLDTQGF